MRPELVKGRYAQVLMDLCDRNSLVALRAVDVIAASGMSKPTFYHHFSNMSDLVNYTASRSFLGTGTALFSGPNILGAYEFAQEHRGFFAQLPLQAGPGSFKETSRRWLRKKGVELYVEPTLPSAERLRRTIQLNMFLAGCLDVMEMWLDGDMALPVEAVVGGVVSMMPPFMAQAAGDVPPIVPWDFPK